MKRVLAPLALAALSLAACSAEAPPIDPAALTYHKDLRPLVEQNCLNCHVEGGIAPFALDTLEAVQAHKTEIKIAVMNRVMPPWMPGKGCADYYGDRSLSDAQIDTVVRWVDGGALAGDPASYAAPTPRAQIKLSRVDRTLQIPTVYTPTKSPDDYRCFLVDWPETTDTYISGFRANPGDARIVHHVIAFLATPGNLATYQKLDDDEAGPGYTCFGGPGGSGVGPGSQAAWLGAWAPGSLGTDFPPGTGVKVPAGSKVILQVHYNTATIAPAPDQTSMDFKIETSVTKVAVVQPWTNTQWVAQKQMVIPAGMPDVMHSYTLDPTPFMSYITGGVIAAGAPFTIYSANLHMHTRGTQARLDILRADGTRECLLEIPRWDFHWQGAYGLTTPKVFNPGDSVYLECHWDNSTTTHDVNWGEGTDDEMCLGGFYITQ